MQPNEPDMMQLAAVSWGCGGLMWLTVAWINFRMRLKAVKSRMSATEAALDEVTRENASMKVMLALPSSFADERRTCEFTLAAINSALATEREASNGR